MVNMILSAFLLASWWAWPALQHTLCERQIRDEAVRVLQPSDDIDFDRVWDAWEEEFTDLMARSM